MKAIFKYPIFGHDMEILLPEGYEVISAINQNGVITLYALVSPEAKTEKVKFSTVGTGWDLPDDFLITNEFVATVNCDPLVWHVFREKKVEPVPKNGDCPICAGEVEMTDPNELPFKTTCLNCGYSVEIIDPAVVILNLLGKSYVIDANAGDETNRATLSAFEEQVAKARELAP